MFYLFQKFLISGIFVGNNIAHLANDKRRDGFKSKRKTTVEPQIYLGGPLVGPAFPAYKFPAVPFRHHSSKGVK